MDSFLRNIVIILFAASVVMLGAQELRARHAKTKIEDASKKQEEAAKLVQELHGRDVKIRGTKKQKRPSSNELEEEEYEVVESPVGVDRGDKLTGEDKSQLRDLLEKLSP